MARAFREVLQEDLYKHSFSKVVFAIKSNGRPDDNYHVFSKVLGSDTICSTVSGGNISILGDSICTLDGYNPSEYSCFYTDLNCKRACVFEKNDTWLGIVLRNLRGKLLVNNAWSGSRVTKLPDKERLFPSACACERLGHLHRNSVLPDKIIIYMGINDWANGVPLSGADPYGVFSNAYMYMLNQLHHNYPKAEICCCTLCRTRMSDNPSFVFPETYGGISLSDYNKCIRTVVMQARCTLVDIASYEQRYDTLDGTHPNASGMQTLARLFCAAYDDAHSRRM